MSRQHVIATVYDKKGRSLAVGYNSYTKTHPRQAYFARLAGLQRKMYLHAEIAAIIRGQHLGQPYRIHVERRGKDGRMRLAKPCPICALAIREAGIKIVSYSI